MNAIVILCDTLRRDHVGAYSHGKPLNQCWSSQAPDWSVPTPNMDRLAERGVTFDQCWHGSTPCMPARRDIYTGRYEFLERGWGPLAEEDKDLPRQVSGPPNQAIKRTLADGYKISELITDHFHLWEQGAGNYHMGYSGFEFVRGCESDALYTDPVEFDCPEPDMMRKTERHYRNIHYLRQGEGDYFCAQVVQRACRWLELNRAHDDFYLHLDIFDPHEPWDPPERILKMFDPKGYAVDGLGGAAPYAPWEQSYTPEQFHNMRARYAAKVAFLDEWLGRLFDTMERLDLWKDTVVILTTDHGTFNGDHSRMGKLQTHEHDAKAHIPFVVACPDTRVHGQRRNQLAQLVDIYPTVLSAVGMPLPDMPDDKPIHGVDLLPALSDPTAPTRDYAVCGQFGQSVTLTDGDWILHQAPNAQNLPLYWHGYNWSRFLHYDLGDYKDGVRPVLTNPDWGTPTWLSDRRADPNELENLAAAQPAKLREMQGKLADELTRLKAPAWQKERLGLI